MFIPLLQITAQIRFIQPLQFFIGQTEKLLPFVLTFYEKMMSVYALSFIFMYIFQCPKNMMTM